MTRAALFFLCCTALLAGCKQKEQCRPARVTARTAWLRYRVAVRAEVERGLASLEKKLRQAKKKLAKLNALRACSRRTAPDSPTVPAACLKQAGLTRAPSYQETLAEQRGLDAQQRTQQRLTREAGRIDRIDAVIKRLDCPASDVRRATNSVPADPGPRVRLLREAAAASERLVACAEGKEIAEGPHCRLETK